MADEISVNLRFDVINGNYRPGAINLTGLTFDQAAAGAAGELQTFTTADSAVLSAGGITLRGMLFMRNIESSSSLSLNWGFTTGEMNGRLYAGEVALLRTNTTCDVIAISGGVGSCRVQYRWLQN
jgi:hypothetical protein